MVTETWEACLFCFVKMGGARADWQIQNTERGWCDREVVGHTADVRFIFYNEKNPDYVYSCQESRGLNVAK